MKRLRGLRCAYCNVRFSGMDAKKYEHARTVECPQLTKLKLLPQCMHIELHHLLYLLAMQKTDYDLDISLESDNSNAEQTRLVFRGEFKVDKSRLTNTDNNFFKDQSTLQSNDQKTQIYGQNLNKGRLLKIYWNFFNRFFTPDNNCTCRILCRCGSCNPLSKLITD